MAKPLLEVRDLHVHFPVSRGGLRRPRQSVRAVNGVTFELGTGETLGLVGESGCGKTTLGRALLRLIPITSGKISFAGQDITRLEGAKLRAVRREFQMIFQDPYGALDPRMTARAIVGEALDIHRLARDRTQRERQIEQLLNDVGLEPGQANRYPHEFSGGQRQRLGIGRALAMRPSLLVCDEPVSALDVSVQAQVINLLQDLQQQLGLAYLFIAHDLAVVEHISRRIMVMYLGQIVEIGEARELCRNPQHPYTKALLSAIPEIEPTSGRKRILLAGDVPSPVDPPSGCPFHPRCPVAEARCRSNAPLLRETSTGHSVCCHLA